MRCAFQTMAEHPEALETVAIRATQQPNLSVRDGPEEE